MLQNLKNINTLEVQHLLSLATKSLLPNPGISTPEALNVEIKSRLPKVLREVRKKLKLATRDNSREAKSKMLGFLSSEMTSLFFNEVKFKQAKDRIGLKGDLRPNQYSIKIGDISKEFNSRGIRNSHVENVLRNPDYVEHLLRGATVANDTPISVFVKENLEDKKHDKFILVVETNRDGSTLMVSQAWRVYYSDVELSQHLSPVNILQSFVMKYGISFQIADSHPKKFYLYETVSAPLCGQPKESIKINQESNKSIVVSFHFKENPSGLIEIALAYVIDTDKYKEDLLKHNVLVE
ncbi:MAG: hypothetical protein ACUZ8H_00380 [Candidatus Anammoxibacter sp.]